jgi:hypothetical protein
LLSGCHANAASLLDFIPGVAATKMLGQIQTIGCFNTSIAISDISDSNADLAARSPEFGECHPSAEDQPFQQSLPARPDFPDR